MEVPEVATDVGNDPTQCSSGLPTQERPPDPMNGDIDDYPAPATVDEVCFHGDREGICDSSKAFDGRLVDDIDWTPSEDAAAKAPRINYIDLDRDDSDDDLPHEGRPPPRGSVVDRRGDRTSSSGTEDSSSDTASSVETSSDKGDGEKVKHRTKKRERTASNSSLEVIEVEISGGSSVAGSAGGAGQRFDRARSIVNYDSSSSSSSDDDDEEVSALRAKVQNLGKREGKGKGPDVIQKPLRVEGELLVEDLPAIEELSLTIDNNVELQLIGNISAVVDTLVVVQSLSGSPGLDADSFLFREDRTAIGKIFEIFGPVISPYYTVRFNSEKHVQEFGVVVGMPVFFAPQREDFSRLVLPSQIPREKGSDASWKNDCEPPAGLLDYSDDETEKRERRKLRGKGADDANSNASDARGPRPKAFAARHRRPKDTSLPGADASLPQPFPAPVRVPRPSFHVAAPPPWPGTPRPSGAPQVRAGPPPIIVGDWRHRPPPALGAWGGGAPPPRGPGFHQPPPTPPPRGPGFHQPPPPTPPLPQGPGFHQPPPPTPPLPQFPGWSGPPHANAPTDNAPPTFPAPPPALYPSPPLPGTSPSRDWRDQPATGPAQGSFSSSGPPRPQWEAAAAAGSEWQPPQVGSTPPAGGSNAAGAEVGKQEDAAPGQSQEFNHLFEKYFEYYSNYYQSHGNPSS